MICRKCKREVPDAPFCCQCGAKQEANKKTRRGNGTGYVYKRGKYWYAQITLYLHEVEGKVKRKTKTKGGFQTKRDALEYLTMLKSADNRVAPKLIDLYTDFETHDLPALSKSKRSAYRIARERIEPLMGMRIDDLTVKRMQDVIDTSCDSFYKARDCKNLLSKLYQKAMPDQYVTQNLSAFIVTPENKEAEPVPFSPEEVQTMWKAFSDGELFVGYLLLMIYSGMMPGELFACRKDMISLDKCEIYGCGKKTKTRKENAIVFADIVRPVVEELITWQQGEKLVNVHETIWYDQYHTTVQKLGIRDLPPYSCRHTTGTEAAKQNLNAAIVQKIMRHSKITTSQRYIHLGTEETHRGVNAIAPSKRAEEKQKIQQNSQNST